MLGPIDEARDVVERIDLGERVDLAADRRHVYALDGALAGGKRDAAGEALHHLADRLPAQGEISVDLGAAGDRIDAGNLAQGWRPNSASVSRNAACPRRHRPAGKAAVGFQRPVEKPAGERTQRQRPLGYGYIDVGLFDAVSAEKEGLGVERKRSGEPIEDCEVDRFVGPARELRCRTLGAVPARAAPDDGASPDSVSPAVVRPPPNHARSSTPP